MFVPTLIRCAAPALLAVLALAGPAPAAQDGGNRAPRAAHATPSNVEPALAAERYYSSYGDVGSEVTAPADAGGRDGIGVAPFVLALSGALLLGLSVGSLAPLAHARRRHRVGIAS